MTRTWTADEIRWLRENYRFGTIAYTCEAFEREFDESGIVREAWIEGGEK